MEKESRWWVPGVGGLMFDGEFQLGRWKALETDGGDGYTRA